MAESCIKIPTETTLEKMIDREEELRLSIEYQDECSKVSHIPNGWLTIVTESFQKQVVKEFGFTSEISMNIALNALRRARYLYPNNNKFKEPVYVRNNKASIGKLKENDTYPNIELFTVNNKIINLSDLINENKLNLILCGSHT